VLIPLQYDAVSLVPAVTVLQLAAANGVADWAVHVPDTL
jgi:hypothetical protein